MLDLSLTVFWLFPLGLLVGAFGTLLGVGGGFIHVPALTGLLNFPVHVATATSHFVLAMMALTGTLVHVATGVFAHGVRQTAILAIELFSALRPARACPIASAANGSFAAWPSRWCSSAFDLS